MANETTPQQLNATVPQVLELSEIQGDILLGMQKFFECFLFFEIKDAAAFKAALHHKILHHITTSQVVRLREFDFRDHKAQGSKQMIPWWA